MYQALYRKWRPRTFDEVVGQPHITDTLKRQVAGNRLSHAYLFTGTRGTGKTTCAKILARAVNCQDPREGNPCNLCPACAGIENGSILDVLELDAASNNGIDHVRALRDEAVYTPAAVARRVYIVDEVHMLSTPAFNALLKLLEEPPPHLIFILATTELHKVPATIKSRCQQFAFKRILPGYIAQHVSYVAQQEGIDLSPDGAALLARLADGGLRDALSLLDQCAGAAQRLEEGDILDLLALTGNLELAALMEQIARRSVPDALTTLGRLYASGKDVASVLEQLSGLSRDLLLRKLAPEGGGALLTGGFEEETLRALAKQFSPQRLLYFLHQLQNTIAALSRSSNRRTDAELCLIRLCDEGLEDSLPALSARITRLEELLAQSPAATPPLQIQPAATIDAPPLREMQPERDTPPWETQPERNAPPPEPERSPPSGTPTPASPPAPPVTRPASGRMQSSWSAFLDRVKGKLPSTVAPYLTNPAKVTGVWKNGKLTLWTDSDFTRSLLNKPAILQSLTQTARDFFGTEPHLSVMTGVPPESESETSAPDGDALDALVAFGQQFDNITIQE